MIQFFNQAKDISIKAFTLLSSAFNSLIILVENICSPLNKEIILKTMHPKNPFIADYDFDTLTKVHSSLTSHVFQNQYGMQTIKFADSIAVKELNTALLKLQYAIDWDLPEGNLCPPIPGRLDYLLHIADLIPDKKISLLDIGTGANLIYPILAVSHFQWTCVASEVQLASFNHAQKIIDDNAKLSAIELRFQKQNYKILENIIQATDNFDAVVCNPPFFKNEQDAQKANARKVKNLQLKEKESLNFGGLSNELWYKGGEEAFIIRMIQESEQFKKQVQWFTSLVSNKESLKNIKRAMNKTSTQETRIIEMAQGNKISRFVAWRF